MESVSSTLSDSSKQTHDDFFCRQLASHLKQLPESLEKETLKMELMQKLIKFKYQTD